MGDFVRPADSSYSKRTNRIVTAVFAVLSVLFFLPVLLVIIVSVSSQDSVTAVGYSYFPREFSLEAYRYLFNSGMYLARSFVNSVIITIAGTVLGLILMYPMAYALSRREYRMRGFLIVFIMIPMLFSGGLVASYMVNTQLMHLKNTYFALIFPGLCSTWYILIMRNYFMDALPDSLIEAAKLDGGNNFQIITKVVIPLTKPVIICACQYGEKYRDGNTRCTVSYGNAVIHTSGRNDPDGYGGTCHTSDNDLIPVFPEVP